MEREYAWHGVPKRRRRPRRNSSTTHTLTRLCLMHVCARSTLVTHSIDGTASQNKAGSRRKRRVKACERRNEEEGRGKEGGKKGERRRREGSEKEARILSDVPPTLEPLADPSNYLKRRNRYYQGHLFYNTSFTSILVLFAVRLLTLDQGGSNS
jgi:hypothetical protein